MQVFFALALAASAAALPSQEAHHPATRTIEFTGVALETAGTIAHAQVAANSSSFWLNKDTATYTPDDIKDSSTTRRTNDTVFSYYLPDDTLDLYTEVPDVQQVYVAADGLLKFTQAFNGSVNNDSIVHGFGIAQGYLIFENNSFIAVPTNDSSNDPDGQAKAYQIYAASRTDLSGESFQIRAVPFNGDLSAWEYI